MLSACLSPVVSVVLTMGTFMYCIDKKEDTSIVQKKSAMGNHRMAVAMLNGSYCTHPFMREPSTRSTAMKHCATWVQRTRSYSVWSIVVHSHIFISVGEG